MDDRFARQVRLPGFGPEGQRRLLAGSVLIVGVGGLGAPAALYLAAAGVGRIGLMDPDAVEPSNLHRQVIYTANDVGKPKVAAARERLLAIDDRLRVELHPRRFDLDGAAVVADYDVVIDGTDDLAAKAAINAACVRHGTPLVHGAVQGMEGQVALFAAPDGPCYHCLYAEAPPPDMAPPCADAGILGPVPGVIGTMQALEAIKLLAGMPSTLAGRLLLWDGNDGTTRTVTVPKDPACPVCAEGAGGGSLAAHRRQGVRDRPTGRRQDAGQPQDARQRQEAKKRPDAKERPSEQNAGGAVPGPVPQWPPERLVAARAEALPLVLLDVRSDEEREYAAIPDSIHIPMQDVPQRIGDLPTDRPVVAYCHAGARSDAVARFLRERGFDAVNLQGGIDAWSARIDPKVPRY